MELPTAVVLIVAGLGAISGVIAFTAANAAACGVGLYLLAARWRGKGGGGPSGPPTRLMLKFGRQVWFTDLAFLGFSTVDQIMLQAFRGSRSVGVYDIAWQLTTGLTLLSLAISSAVAPRLRDADRAFVNELFARTACALARALRGDRRPDRPAREPPGGRAVRPGLRVLGPGAGGPDPVRAVARRRAAGIDGPQLPRDRTRAQAHRRDRAAHQRGARRDPHPLARDIGPTIGTGIAFTYYVLAHCLLYRRTDVAVPWRRCAYSLVRGAVAGLVGGGVALVWLHGFSTEQLPAVLAAIVLGAAGAAVTLIAVGEWDMSLLRLLRERPA